MKMSDRSMRMAYAIGDLDLHPEPEDRQWQPCSLDLRLGSSFRWPEQAGGFVTGSTVLLPGKFLLANTRERVTMGHAFMGQVHGKSTWARRGLLVEAAGLIDPGFEGTITLELFNLSSRAIPLFAGDTICQLTLERLDWPATRPYGHPELGSHYQGQSGATVAYDQ